MELDAVVSAEFRGTFPLNSTEIDVIECHGNISTEIDGIPWKYFLRCVPSYLKGLCHAIFYLFKKIKGVFLSIESQE